MKLWALNALIVFTISAISASGEPISPRMAQLATTYLSLITSKDFTDNVSQHGDETALVKSRIEQLEQSMGRAQKAESPKGRYLEGDTNIYTLLVVARAAMFEVLSGPYYNAPKDDALLDKAVSCRTLAKFSIRAHSFIGWKSGDATCLDIEPGAPLPLVLDTAVAFLNAQLRIANDRQRLYLEQKRNRDASDGKEH